MRRDASRCVSTATYNVNMETSVITSKGQVLIPVKIRKKFGIKGETKVAFIEQGEKLIMLPLNKEYINLAGILNGRGKCSNLL